MTNNNVTQEALPVYMIDNILRRTRKAVTVGLLAFLACYAVAHICRNIPNLSNSRYIVASASHQELSSSGDQIIVEVSRDFAPSSAEFVQSSIADRAEQKGMKFARSFITKQGLPVHGDPHYWCTQETYGKSCKNETHQLCNPKGLLFVKTPKTGSTTASRIMKRIVHNVAQRDNVTTCQHREDHVTGAGLWYGSRVRNQSFLVASLRDPAQRAMSRFFWSYVTRKSNNTNEIQTDDAFIKDYLNETTNVASGCTSKGQGGYQLNYITLQSIPKWSAWDPLHPTRIIDNTRTEGYVAQLMDDYDFLILNERMEESLVVMKLMLGLETGDILSLSYNVGGSYRYQNGKCVQLIKPHTSSGMQEYFESDEWYAKNYGDYLLYAAANQSLDMTINQLGKETFEAALQDFHRLQAKVNEVCKERVPFPCASDGTVLFHAVQPLPHQKISACIDDIVQKEQDTNVL